MISQKMMKQKENSFDVILITGEYYDDHPLSPAGVIARVLDAKGYAVGIIEKPRAKEDFSRLGKPKLCYCVTSGSIDSMLNNYTPLKKKRSEDKHCKSTEIPDRAVIVYCNKIKELDKTSRIIIGGIEASLRRFAHYDYWDNKVRKSILLDSRADILVYGNGEKQIIEICERLKSNANADLAGIRGTCIICKSVDKQFIVMPSFADIQKDNELFCKSHVLFSNYKNLAQKYDNNYVVQYEYPNYAPEDLDWVYSLPYSRELNKKSLLKMARFSVITHRGCIGNCNFCSLSLHQGNRIISRSEKSILAEMKNMTKLAGFKGLIDDLGGPSANMYGMDCCRCDANNCTSCERLDKSHKRLINLLREARKIKGVKKIFIRSGIRYDLALASKEYIKEISEHHISGCLKIAPEHLSENVLKLMNKDNGNFDDFLALFKSLNKGNKQELRYYFMICHPGDSIEETTKLKEKMMQLRNIEQFQLFTPLPMTISSAMYWTGLNPYTLEKIDVVRDYKTKKRMKRIMLSSIN